MIRNKKNGGYGLHLCHDTVVRKHFAIAKISEAHLFYSTELNAITYLIMRDKYVYTYATPLPNI